MRLKDVCPVAEPIVPIPGIVDRAWRLAFWLGFRLALVWWRIRRPHHHGAMVAVWLDGRILGVRQSYTDRLTWPGGGIDPGEDPTRAAQRELHEELGLAVRAEDLTLIRKVTVDIDYRRDHITLFELHLAALPPIRLDPRELTRAAFMRPQEMLAMKTPPFVAPYLRDRADRVAAGAVS
jgi:8-oxo-dGTP diphosphatase